MPGLDSLYSKVSSVGEKLSLNNITNTIKDGLGKLSSAAQNAAGSTSLQIKSAFESKGIPLPAISMSNVMGSTPQESVQKMNTPYGSAVYPAQMKYYTMFTFQSYKRAKFLESAQQKPSFTAVLPMPSNLVESFSVDYDTPALGPIVGSLTEGALNQLRQSSSITELGSKAAGITGEQAVKGVAASAMNAIKGTSPAGETAMNVAALAAGAVPNPHLAVIFRNIGLREHSFNYRFAPNSQKELETIKKIIKELKTRMLPGMHGGSEALYTFPDTCDISFGPTPDVPYKIKTCVLKTLSVNYAPNGPAFFKTGDPVIVDIQMTFMETSPFTREDLSKDAGDGTSSAPLTSGGDRGTRGGA